MNVKSMTGYSKKEQELENLKLTIEIRSVNHRFLDLNLKIPQNYWSLENKLRKVVSSFVSRGHLDIYITRDVLSTNEESSFSINRPLLESYMAVYEEAFETYLGSSISKEVFENILNKKDVITQREESIPISEQETLVDLLQSALENLNIMKEKEGEELLKDLVFRFDKLKNIREEICFKVSENENNKTYFNKLKEKIDNVINDFNLKLNEDRIVTEVALIIDKLDITEELVRLSSHFKQAENILKEFPIGRKMEFLLQEITREFNTIASKINDALIQAKVVEAKTELEKIREQIQNIE